MWFNSSVCLKRRIVISNISIPYLLKRSVTWYISTLHITPVNMANPYSRRLSKKIDSQVFINRLE